MSRALEDVARSRPTLVWLLVIISVLPWRQEVYYSGGLDAVVVAKALVGVLALALAFEQWWRCTERQPVGVRSALLVLTYVTLSVLGGWAAGSLLSSLVLAVRVVILVATILLHVSSQEIASVVRSMRNGLAVVGLITAGTGVSTYVEEGRLGGGLFPVSPNLLSMVFGVVVVVDLWGRFNGRTHRFDLAGIGVFTTLVWATGSRTGLAAMLLGVVVLVFTARRRPTAVFVAAVAALPLSCYVLTSTGFLAAFFQRGGDASVLTLNSRTIAWSAAFEAPYEFWGTWFGRGMSAKTVGVSGTFWDTQVLDSSWVSAYVQAGVLGLLVLAVWAMATVLSSSRIGHPFRSLFVPLVLFVLVWSVTASGLLDSYVLFLLMFTTAVLTERTTWSGRPDVTDDPGPGPGGAAGQGVSSTAGRQAVAARSGRIP